jgi:hypothetical protein
MAMVRRVLIIEQVWCSGRWPAFETEFVSEGRSKPQKTDSLAVKRAAVVVLCAEFRS